MLRRYRAWLPERSAAKDPKDQPDPKALRDQRGPLGSQVPPDLLALPGQSDLLGFRVLLGLSVILALQDRSDLSGLPGLRDLPDLSVILALQDLSDLPGLRDLPGLSGILALADRPDLPGLQDPLVLLDP